MTYTSRLRGARPEVARMRDARSTILEAVYGPSIIPVNKGGVPFGLRDATRRTSNPVIRRKIIQNNWRDAKWPEGKLEMVLADAGMTWEGLNEGEDFG